MRTVRLKSGHVQPVHFGHPWVFQQAVENVGGGALPGDDVVVLDPRGNALGRGLYSPGSAIPVRIFTRNLDVPIDGALFRHRVKRAAELRASLGLPSRAEGRETNAYRLIHAEGDGLPGLIVDVFDDVAVVQMNTIGVHRRKGLVVDALIDAGLRVVIDRTPAAAAQAEGFEQTAPDSPDAILRGQLEPRRLKFVERGFRFEIPLEMTQKTGFYLDQRLLRTRVEQLARGRRVLDTFAFVGTFSLAAARGGATEVIAVDESAPALEAAAEIARLNGLHDKIKFIRRDARAALSDASARGGYDMCICDPPKLAPRRGARTGALAGYRKLAAAACRATKPGGILVFCSCSGAVGMESLIRAVAMGSRDANMSTTVLERHHQGPDHPVDAAFPEGLYLKSIIARVDAREQ